MDILGRGLSRSSQNLDVELLARNLDQAVLELRQSGTKEAERLANALCLGLLDALGVVEISDAVRGRMLFECSFGYRNSEALSAGEAKTHHLYQIIFVLFIVTFLIFMGIDLYHLDYYRLALDLICLIVALSTIFMADSGFVVISRLANIMLKLRQVIEKSGRFDHDALFVLGDGVDINSIPDVAKGAVALVSEVTQSIYFYGEEIVYNAQTADKTLLHLYAGLRNTGIRRLIYIWHRDRASSSGA